MGKSQLIEKHMTVTELMPPVLDQATIRKAQVVTACYSVSKDDLKEMLDALGLLAVT